MVQSSFYIKKEIIDKRSRVRPGVETTDQSIMMFIFGFYFRNTVIHFCHICSLSKELLDKEIPEYVLKWGDHNNQLLHIFQELWQEKSFTDVSLATDRVTFQAHKLVLSACSPYLRSLFIANPSKHPMVFLKVRSQSHN